MAKAKAPSKHSRAARRAAAPPMASGPTPSVARQPESITSLHREALIPRKRRKPSRKSTLSTRARRRAQRDADTAVAVSERTGAKIERSKGKAQVVRERRRGWDEVNKNAGGGADKGKGGGSGFEVLAEDEDMGGVEEEGKMEADGEGEGEGDVDVDVIL